MIADTRRAVEAERALLGAARRRLSPALRRHADRAAGPRRAAVPARRRRAGAALELLPRRCAGRPDTARRRRAGRCTPGTAAAPSARASSRSRAALRAQRRRLEAATAAVHRPSPRAARRAIRAAIDPPRASGCPGIEPGRRWPSAASGSRAAPTGWALPRSSRCWLSRCCSCRRAQWTVLTHAEAAAGWPRRRGDRDLPPCATARRGERGGAPPADATHVYWHSGAQFERWQRPAGAGRAARLRSGQDLRAPAPRRGAESARVPAVAQWRQWLRPVSRSAGQGGLSIAPMRRTALIAGRGAGVARAAAGAGGVVGDRDRAPGAAASPRSKRCGQRTGCRRAAQWSRTRLMLVGESSTFLALLLAVSLLLAWLYWREQRRARACRRSSPR